ncbi:hypothetical protein H9Y04_42225 [Streptomyces sp. TRM66268-LWL]|uniref:Bacterial Ig domain-containing protein n=1 Tax=Streptomyces polyasparticus TaxID=2767826 RepID=A0ABR7SUG7_9ACTN|nr:Ig-like domain-containing protein [Streptomyces polyasparticus]MBC9719149.1 hypothetical protein [Streptomyces polyasparticus]
MTFAYTGANQTFTVPDRAIELKAELKGAGGGGSFELPPAGGSQQAGAGGVTTATMPVQPGQQLTVVVGGGGKSGDNGRRGGFGGGGHGGNSGRAGGGGGGRSGIALGTTQLAIAGGGGGAGGGTSQPGAAAGAGGGTTGAGATIPAVGGGGTESAGGAAGAGSGCTALPLEGVRLQGGSGGSMNNTTGTPDAGGGGGGGWFGGGGGACSSATSRFGDGGGGGGSGYLNSSRQVTGTTTQGGGGTAGTNTKDGGNGSVKLQWRLLEPPTITGPVTGDLEGEGEPGAVVTVKDKDGNTVCTATVNPDGSWSCTPSKLMPCGPNEFTATQTKGGVTSEVGSYTVDVGQPCVSPPVITEAEEKEPVTGVAKVKVPAQVTVRDQDGNVVCTATVKADGTWSCSPKKPLPPCTELTATITKDGVTSKPSKMYRTYCPPKYGKK